MDERTRRILTDAHDKLLVDNAAENALIEELHSVRVYKFPFYSDQSDLAIAISTLTQARDKRIKARNILLDILKTGDE